MEVYRHNESPTLQKPEWLAQMWQRVDWSLMQSHDYRYRSRPTVPESSRQLRIVYAGCRANSQKSYTTQDGSHPETLFDEGNCS